MQSPIMHLHLPAFKAAAAEGAAMELMVRLLAAKVLVPPAKAHNDHWVDVKKSITELFAGCLTPDEIATLDLCRQLRNKIFHADFFVAREKLRNLGAAPVSGGVLKVVTPTNLNIASMETLLAQVKSGEVGKRVADTGTTAEGTIYGWFMELGQGGDFEKAAGAFREGAAIIERLAELDGPVAS